MSTSKKFTWPLAENFEDLNVHIRMRPYDGDSENCYVVMFEVFHIFEYGKVGEKLEYKFQNKESLSSPDPVDNADEAETLITGSIRFDGCSNVNFGNSHGYIHGCGRQEMTRFGEIFENLFDGARELMTGINDLG